MKKSIFIQITSYHDYELEKTIRNAIEKSSGKNKLVFGVHSIFYEDNSWVSPIKEIPNVKLIQSKAPENLGMGVGRAIAHQFYSGEDYYFQIDAHSRFDDNWDLFLINEISIHKSSGYNKPLITNYPKPYWYEGNIEKTRDHEEVVTQFYWKDKHRFELYRTPMQGTIKNPDNNIHSISISGGCIFTEGDFLKPNNLIFADGEEIFIAARAYTNGYDLFVPSKTFMYHLYSDIGSTGKNARRLVPADWPDQTAHLEKISKDEIKIVLSEDGVVGEYRLGTERTLDQYGEFSGLDFKTGQIIKNYI
jgi:hypothetical protein